MKRKVLTPILCFIFFFCAKAQIDSISNSESCVIGKQLMYDSKFDEAIQQYEKCLRLTVDSAAVLNDLGLCYYQLGRYRDAKGFYEKVLTINPESSTALTYLGIINDKEGLNAKAFQYFTQLVQLDSTNAYAFKLLGYSALKNEQLIEALSFFERSLKINPSDLNLVSEVATLYMQSSAMDLADTVLQKGLAIDSSNVRLLTDKAEWYYRQQQFVNVVKIIEHCMVLGDTSVYGQKMLGVAYNNASQYQKAIVCLERLLPKAKTGKEIVLQQLAIAYKELNQLEKARMYYKLTLNEAIGQNTPSYYKELGKIAELEKQWQQAFEYYKMALYYDPLDATLFFRLGQILELFLEDKPQAIVFYEQYLASEDVKYKKVVEEKLLVLKEKQVMNDK